MGKQCDPVASALGYECGWPRSRTLLPAGLLRSAGGSAPAWHQLNSLPPHGSTSSSSAPFLEEPGLCSWAAGHPAHQHVEVDPLTVFLARGEKGGPVGIPVTALIQVGPRRVPPLIHGGIIPDAWRKERARPWRWSHISTKDCLLPLTNSLWKVSLLQEALQDGQRRATPLPW